MPQHKAMQLIESLKPLLKKYRSFIMYVIIGGSGALLDLVVFLILYNILGINPLVATVLSTSLGIANNFILNLLFNFKVRDKIYKRMAMFYLVGLSGLLLSIIVIFIVHNILGVNANVAKLLSIPVVVVFQYVLNSRLSFGNAELVHMIINRRNLFIFLALALVYSLFVTHLTYFGFSDEYDNILGGWLISHQGQLVYHDFFSHHMPLPYFVAAFITVFTGDSLNAFRFVFVNGLFIWALLIAHRMSRVFGVLCAFMFLLLIASTQHLVWAHMLLAETLIAYALIHALMFIVFNQWSSSRAIKLYDILVITILGAIPIFSSLSYAPLSALIYVSFAVVYLRRMWPFSSRAQLFILARDMLIVSTPYLMLGVYLSLTNSLHAFVTQAYRFNTLYYSQFTNDVGSTFGTTVAKNLQNFLQNTQQVLHLSPGGSGVISTLSLTLVVSISIWLLYTRRFLLLAWVVVIFYISNIRGQITLTVFDQPAARPAIYAFLICFLIVYGIYILREHPLHRAPSDGARILRLTICGIAVFLASGLIMKGASLNLDISETRRNNTETGIQQTNRGGDLVRVINGVTDKNDYYWVGPFDFYSQMYIDARRSSSYTFFIPWQGACPGCTVEFMSRLQTEKPLVIYWQPDVVLFGANTDEYTPMLQSLLRTDYVQVTDKRLKYYHFLKSDTTEIQGRLKLLGYRI